MTLFETQIVQLIGNQEDADVAELTGQPYNPRPVYRRHKMDLDTVIAYTEAELEIEGRVVYCTNATLCTGHVHSVLTPFDKFDAAMDALQAEVEGHRNTDQ